MIGIRFSYHIPLCSLSLRTRSIMIMELQRTEGAKVRLISVSKIALKLEWPLT
jgi:hypothetical protein